MANDVVDIVVTDSFDNIEVNAVITNDIIDLTVTDNSDNVQINATPNLVTINVSNTSGNIIGSNYYLVSTYSALPLIGDLTVLYVTNDTGLMYRWNGSAYVEVSSSAVVAWGGIVGNLTDQTDLVSALNAKAPLASPTFTGTVSGITKAMVGLSNVDNTTDLLKPISTATQNALNLKYDASNPSNYISGIDSEDVTNALGYTPENSANKGIPNGYPSLDGSGLVPASQLPSYVDDVLEYNNLASFPITGSTGKIYVALDTNKVYRWSGSTYIEISPTVGTIWGGISGTLSNQTDLQNALDAKVPTSRNLTINGVTYDLSEDRSWSISAFAGYTNLVQQPVRAAEAITKGQAVYVSGANGTNILVSKASNVAESSSSKTLGLIDASVSTNGTANVITEGILTGLNTLSATIGDPVWLGTGGNLLYGIANKPLAPSHLVFIGFVTRVNANNGEIFVKVQNGFELGELHNVQAPNGSAVNNDGLFWETSTQLWKNKSIATALGYTPVTNARTITINGTTQDLSANRSWNVTNLKTWWDYVLGKTSYTQTTVSGGVVYEMSYSGTTEKRYRFVGNPYDAATDIIYTTFSGGVLSNPVASKLITL